MENKIYQVILKVPYIKKEKVEDFLYEHIPKGWETIEKKFKVYFIFYLKEESPELALLEEFLEKNLEIKLEYKLLKEENWEEIWKAHFKPLKIGKSLVIIPPWEKYKPSPYEAIVIIEAGQAFGTGHHPTTKMMLENIEIFKEKIKDSNLKIIDLGCGTGILSIACAKLFKNSTIFAVDIDDLAIEASKKNAILNKLEDKIIIQKEIPQEKFHLILANIGYREIKNLAKIIKNFSQIGSHVFLSGFLNIDAVNIINIYQNMGYSLIKHQKENEWSFLWLKLITN
uniref:Ribosomal protein L11 methyltransferase n=1 Tax=Thermodesulfobacterium geofontis TaxID=1295609 RepID=A0A7V4N4P9_9BACT